ncbi:DUF2897 family protein [Aliidiomarina halalkaliphila]|nr:DUF2897 family protein [Aliidiomarina halalkaliphila]
MSVWGVIIIVLALGIILSNIMLVKKTAHMKMPDSVVKKAEEQRRYEEQLRDEANKDTHATLDSKKAQAEHSSNEEFTQKNED